MTTTLASSLLKPDQLLQQTYPTPYLMMDLGDIERSYRELETALPGVHIHYAMKCNPDRPILERVQALGGSFEIASYPELEELMALGVDPATVIFSNPVKISSHIESAARAGLWRFAFDSEAELEKLAKHAPGAGVYARLAVEDKASVVPSEGKFGVSATAVEHLLRRAAELGLRPYGLAFHVGSQKTEPQAWAAAIGECAGIMRRLEADGIPLQMLDIGGGFTAPYTDHEPDLEGTGRVIMRALEQLPYDVTVVAEPGRGLVAGAGVMVATIIGTAHRGGKHWLHLDVGAFNGMMESLESANQLLFPLADELASTDRQTYHVTGPSCDSQDTLLFDAELSAGLRTGHKVFIYSAGAYTTSYASRFNGFDIPEIHYQ
jgi:ornithine decarboxylase